ncbi:uncharacterized protein BYT42DRAFT_547734 [Radiomyces spectabilis]|uniref:uncharacterized protein n=1 Tax=Radiomyces spectabilis TaxID=64574 RepID=UPI00222038DD|nr:uncharacterized protein BYT42DRAFT_547734 [Radiomyces spectabilis]KAI8374745.1 hypothetical protein BYT42DRAFT_547734 [Radiomyces spectabilis]
MSDAPSPNEELSKSLPRIKLKLRLNPTAPSAQDVPPKKKHKKDKKKRSHKKHKTSSSDDTPSSLPSSSSHTPVGGKRPFALLQSQESSSKWQDTDQAEGNDYYSPSTEVKSITGDPLSGTDAESYWSYDAEHPTQPTAANSSKTKFKNNKTQTEKPKKRGRPPKVHTPPKKPARVWESPKNDLKNVATRLLDTLIRKDQYGFFLEPVDTRIVTDYLDVIKHPMDFSTMRKKLERDEYKHLDDFRADFLLVVCNAKLYNAPSTIYWRNADRLQQSGLKIIERADKTIVYQEHQHTNDSPDDDLTSNNSYPDSLRKLSAASVREEEVDILGLDIPRNKSRQGSIDFYGPDSAVDISMSRGMTPLHQLYKKKKKKKKVFDVGVLYGPDGSLNAVSGVPELNAFVPQEHPFATPPEVTTVNPFALPSAFFNHRNHGQPEHTAQHLVHAAHFPDYGPLTALGPQSPGQFYTAQDAFYIYPLYGDDRGEAYAKSIWNFVDALDLEESTTTKIRHLTCGAWDVVTEVLNERKAVYTEFGPVDVSSIMESMNVTSES